MQGLHSSRVKAFKPNRIGTPGRKYTVPPQMLDYPLFYPFWVREMVIEASSKYRLCFDLQILICFNLLGDI